MCVSTEDADASLPSNVLHSLTGNLKTSGQATLAIRSAHFGTYLRMDGRGVNAKEGGGTVNCHECVGLRELFRFIPLNNNTIGIQSVRYGTWLRMDGSSVTGNDCGIVNCQSFAGAMETFFIDAVEDGAVAFRSAKYGTYLRMDGINVSRQPLECGGGVVNCSSEIRSWERFYIDVIRPVVAIKHCRSKMYLRVDCHTNRTGAVCAQTYLGNWEKFIIEKQQDESVCLKSEAFNAYICIEESGKVATCSTVDDKDKFIMVLQPNGFVAFRSMQFGTFLSMTDSGEVVCETSTGQNHFFQVVVDTSY